MGSSGRDTEGPSFYYDYMNIFTVIRLIENVNTSVWTCDQTNEAYKVYFIFSMSVQIGVSTNKFKCKV